MLENAIHKRLASVKYPIEFHRTTKIKNEYNTLKCSELENMEFYIGVLAVEIFLPKEHFHHYLTYVIAMRLQRKS